MSLGLRQMMIRKKKERVILVTGDREWKAIGVIEETFKKERGSDVTLIHGDARGADRLSGIIGERRGWKIIPVPAEWCLFGPRAGPIRNKKMLDMKPDYVYAFHSNIRKSRGTKNCVLQAIRMGIPGELTNAAGKIIDKW